MNERTRRIAANEQRFRIFNDQVRALRVQLDTDSGFACECGNAACTAHLEMSLEQYAHVRNEKIGESADVVQ